MTNADALNRTLFIADNLDVLRGIDSGSIDLVATDPPFNKGVTAFTGITKAGATVSYKDVWTWGDVQQEWADRIREDHPSLYGVVMAANETHSEGMGAFLCWLGVRVLEMHRVLKPAGSLYLHCDDTASAYIRQMLDAVFGASSFRNEIVWRRYGSHNDARGFGRVYDTLMFYAKDGTGIWNGAWRPHDPAYVKQSFRHNDNDGRGPYRTAPLHTGGLMGGGYNYEFRGHTRTWRYPIERMRQMDAEGLIRQARDGKGVPERKVYLNETKGRPVPNLWDDIPALTGNHAERTGYPTQKPLALYRRIIEASSNPGDLVLDPFAGCATTCVAAEGLGRRWIGIDVNEEAGEVLRSRLQLAQGNGNHPVCVLTEPPVRTDDGAAAAPELVLVAQHPRERGLSRREAKERLLADVGMRCQGCGFIPPHAGFLQVDHKRPKKEGGRNEYQNLTLLCGPCNGEKGAKLTLHELRDRLNAEGRMLDPEWYQREGRWA